MKVTRENHAHYMGRLAPILLAGYVAQTWCYYRFLSPNLAYDISIFLGIGLILIAAAFLIHDFCYVATLKDNYLEIRLHPFPYEDEILYSDIEEVEVVSTRFQFSHLKLTTDEGKNIWLYNVDEAHKVAETIKQRRYR
ncbi:MAG: hypothetical protein ACJ76H_15145 [Bacteriovoracaceae bacterium]